LRISGVPYIQKDVLALTSGSKNKVASVSVLNLSNNFKSSNSFFTDRQIIELDSSFHFLKVRGCSAAKSAIE